MKIESHTPAIDQQLKSMPTPKVKAGVSAAKVTSDKKLSKQTSQKRILNWFAQAGVREQDSQSKVVASTDKIRLKNEVLAHRRFNNLERILGKALDFCLDDGKEEDLDPDWFFSFVEMAEDIFSPAMQELWGKIFAVETARPGSFSLKTLRLLKQLTQKDAQIFRHAVNLTSIRKGESTPKLLLGYYQKASLWSFFGKHKEHKLNFAEFGLSYPDILSLMDLGLIHHSEIESGELPMGVSAQWRCSGQILDLTAKNSGTTLIYYKFTTTGAELCKLVNRKKQEAYVKSLKGAIGNAFNIE